MQTGYKAIAITDHVGLGCLERVIHEISEDCAMASSHWDIVAVPGVELTHVPAGAIADAARHAKYLGAKIVVVHGQTLVEPVEAGTNLAAVRSKHVDILAHPGLLTLEEANLAAAAGIFVEISARKGHCLTNGHVVKMARTSGAKLLLNSDSHSSTDLLTASLAASIVRGAGLEETEVQPVLETHPMELLSILSQPRPV